MVTPMVTPFCNIVAEDAINIINTAAGYLGIIRKGVKNHLKKC